MLSMVLSDGEGSFDIVWSVKEIGVLLAILKRINDFLGFKVLLDTYKCEKNMALLCLFISKGLFTYFTDTWNIELIYCTELEKKYTF